MQFQSKWLNMKMCLTKIHSKRCKAVFSNQAPLVVDGGNKSQHDAIYVTRWQSWILSPGSWDWSVGTHMYIYIWYIYVRSWSRLHVHSPYIMFPTWLHQTCWFCDERSLGWCISTWEHIYLHNQRVDDEKIKDAKVSIYICIYTHISYIYTFILSECIIYINIFFLNMSMLMVIVSLQPKAFFFTCMDFQTKA